MNDVKIQIKKRGRKKGDSGKKWTKDDLDFLKSTFLFFTDEELAKVLGRAPKTIHSIRRKFGWLKTGGKKKIDNTLKKIPVIFIFKRNEFNSDRKKIEDFL